MSEYTGTAYKALRESAGLSQSEAAELLQVHPMLISKRERKGKERVRPEVFMALKYAIQKRDAG